MLTIDQALQLIRARGAALPAVSVPAIEALGLVLAEPVHSDIDSPPHDKAMVDGYAVQAADLDSGSAVLEVMEEVMAGGVPSLRVQRGAATRIMTGAPVPDGADAVVMVEQTRVVSSPGSGQTSGPERVQIEAPAVREGQNIMRRATAMQRGQQVLARGHQLRPVEIGLLCEAGCTAVRAVPRPRVAVLATGNELVEPHLRPGPGQIRNSNGPMLAACIARAGALPMQLGIARDERGHLAERVAAGLASDVLLLSGGVSAGVLDLVPSVLAEAGVEQIFHKVQIKPGKPLWFGVRPGEKPTLVFGLPGNPVSTLVCFELFVRPAIEQLAGGTPRQRVMHARLSAAFEHRGNRPTYHPAVLEGSTGDLSVRPLDWKGSADLLTLTQANALIQFPAGDAPHKAGQQVSVLTM